MDKKGFVKRTGRGLFLLCLVASESALAHRGHTHAKPDAKPDAKPPEEKKAEAELNSSYPEINASYERDVKPIFQRSCFDCHSSATRYPWYAGLPFIKTIIQDDITEAKKHLDMTDGFPFEGHASAIENLEAIEEDVREGTMPPLSYRIMHWQAALSDEDREIVIRWTQDSLKRLREARP